VNDNNTAQSKAAESVEKKKRWRATVMPRKAFQPMTDVSATITRPYDNETKAYVAFPGKEFEATKRIADFTDTVEAHDLIKDVLPYEVNIVMPVDSKVAKQQVKGLRTINNEYNNEGYAGTYDILLGRRVQDLPRGSMFSKTGCDPELLDGFVAKYMAHLRTNSTIEQVNAFGQMHDSTQLFMIQGAAGTGKSELVVKTVRFISLLDTRSPDLANTVLLLANSNANVDDMAARLDDSLNNILERLPVVLRMHSMKTEKAMLVANKAKDPDRPDLFLSNDDDATEVPELALKMLQEIQDMHTPQNGVFDRRVKHWSLSLTALIVRALGLSPELAKIDPLAADSPIRAEFAAPLARLINQVAQGYAIDKELYTALFNKARNWVYSKADAVCTTLSNAAESKLYTDGTQPKGEGEVPGPGIQPSLIVVDEGERARECDMWAPFAFYGRGTPILLLGDIKQLGTVVQAVPNYFSKQLKLSFMARQMSLGGMHATLTQQYRYQPNIAKVMEKIFYKDELTTTADRPHRPNEVHIKNYNLATHGRGVNMIFLNMQKDECTRVEEGTSKFNFAQARASIVEVEKMIAFGIPAKDIGIASPYQDMTGLLQRMQAELVNTVPSAQDVLIMNIDAFLGLEREVVILPLTVGNFLGFMDNTQRMCVALTRCRIGFTIIGNIEAMSQAPNYDHIVLKKVLVELRSLHGIVDLEERDDDDLYANLNPSVYEGRDLKFTVVEAIECFNCNKLGHSVKNCPDPLPEKTCNNCQQPGHKAEGCPEPKQPKAPKVKTCFACGDPDHVANACPNRLCTSCNKPGHTEAECSRFRPVASKRQKTSHTPAPAATPSADATMSG